MIHVDGRNVHVSDSSSDRVRLKDKIITNISKAIKSVSIFGVFFLLSLQKKQKKLDMPPGALADPGVQIYQEGGV